MKQRNVKHNSTLDSTKPKNRTSDGYRPALDSNGNHRRRSTDISVSLPSSSSTSYVLPSATYLESLSVNGSLSARSTIGDPLVRFTDNTKLDELKTSALQFIKETAETAASTFGQLTQINKRSSSSSADTSINTTTSSKQEQVSTPMRRQANPISPGQAKRQRTMTNSYNDEADVSIDTVQSVLRLVDESLMYTPERDAITTPTVIRATSGPSPHQNAPAYAYDSLYHRATPKVHKESLRSLWTMRY